MSVGIKQKKLVNEMVSKVIMIRNCIFSGVLLKHMLITPDSILVALQFLSNGFSVMLFHYDGNVNEWNEFSWNERVIHISAINQTKWYHACLIMFLH